MSLEPPMPRFSILVHNHPFLHWDFLLEAGGTCRTWRLLNPPDFPGEIIAEPLADHRLLYLDYEGPVSGDRGEVFRWDAGTFEWRLDNTDAVEIDVVGTQIQGRVSLRRRADQTWIWSVDSARMQSD